MSAANAALARRWFEEVWNQRRVETIYELVTPESVSHGEQGDVFGPEVFHQGYHTEMCQALPDIRVTIEDIVAQGENVVVRWLATGTHLGTGFGCPPTQKKLSFRGMTWITYRDGKMAEGWDCWNVASLMQALSTPT